MSRQTMLIDLDRCTGCFACTVACQTLHDAPARTRRLDVHQIGPYGTFPRLTMHYLPVMCQHCQNPPCLEACPTGATRQSEDGLIRIDEETCNGCGDCVEACPFQARYVNPRSQIAESCDHCQDRTLEDKQPFCAASCTTGAIRICDIDNPDPVAAQWLQNAGENRFQLEPDNAKVAVRTIYLLRRQPWAGWEKIAAVIQNNK